MASSANVQNQTVETNSHAENTTSKEETKEEHAGPHIPSPKGAIIEWWTVGGLHITNTIFSTWIFMGMLAVLVIFMNLAIRTGTFPWLRAFGLDITARILAYATSLLGDKEIAKKYMWLLWGIIVVISQDLYLTGWCLSLRMSGSEHTYARYIQISLRHSCFLLRLY
jgi:hypothetical protein